MSGRSVSQSFVSFDISIYFLLLAPDGPRLQFSPVSFSPAPRGVLLSEPRVSPNVPREGPVEIPNTEELYKALSLRTDKSQIINQFNE